MDDEEREDLLKQQRDKSREIDEAKKQNSHPAIINKLCGELLAIELQIEALDYDAYGFVPEHPVMKENAP